MPDIIIISPILLGVDSLLRYRLKNIPTYPIVEPCRKAWLFSFWDEFLYFTENIIFVRIKAIRKEDNIDG